MERHVGIDVSLEESSVCVMDRPGQILRETKVASAPEALLNFLGRLDHPVTLLGMEAGPLSQWLHAGLAAAGVEVVLMETRQVKAALSAMPIKTDRRAARGIAPLMRMGWFRPVHGKSASAREVRALPTARKQLQQKMLDIALGLRGVLRGFLRSFGLGIGKIPGGITRAGDGMVRAMLHEAAQAMLTRTRSVSRLKAWGLRVARRRGRNRAIVAVARKLATVLHRMWLDGTTFRFGKEDVRTA